MSDRFDDLARTLASPAPVGRRGFGARVLAAVGIGAGAAVVATNRADAAPPVRCPPGFTVCDGSCRDLTDHNSHCGECGRACAADEVCRNGVCTKVPCVCEPTCPPGQTWCAGACRDLRSDEANCGTCGTVCTGGQTCNDGVCGCAPGSEVCGGVCTDTSTSTSNCGACGNVCSGPNATYRCQGGSCVPTCNAGFGNCDGNPANGCETNILSNRAHCGACGRTCGPNEVCQNGSCVCPETDAQACARQGLTCGPTTNICGGHVRTCGTCSWPQTCGGGGREGVCG